MDINEGEGKIISRKNLGIYVVILSIVLAFFQILTVGIRPFYDIIQRSIHLGLSLAIIFEVNKIHLPKNMDSKYKILYNFFINRIFSLFSLVIALYVFTNWERMIFRVWESTVFDKVFGVLLILMILEACRRVVGNVLP